MASVSATTRAQALKCSIRDLCDAGIRKTTFYPIVAQSLKKTLNEPRQLRRAKAFAYLMDNVDLAILPVEILGGSILGMWPLAEEASYEEQLGSAFEAVEKEISLETSVKGNLGRSALMARDHYNANISYSTMQKIIKEVQKKYEGLDKIKPHMIAKVLEQHFVFDYGNDVMDLIYGLPWSVANHVHLNYGMVINTGYGALLQKINTLLSEAEKKADAEKTEFYTAVKISIVAAIRYIKKYSDEYKKAAGEESDRERAAELEEIANLLKTVSTGKATSFREAMQLMWITHIIGNTALGTALSFARFDQYMYPFYKADREAGRITEDEARELIVNMILKVNEPKMRTVQSLALGGTTPDGRDAANDLTRITLEAAREVRMPYPNIALRVAEVLTPEWAYDEAVETIKKGFGMPMLVNDDVWVKTFMSLGYPAEYAREYYNMGCVEMMIQNRQAEWWYVKGGAVVFPNILDSILTDYHAGKLALDKFHDIMEEFIARIRSHVESVGGEFAKESIAQQREHLYDPFGSALIFNCIDKGMDMFQGGSELPAQVAIGGLGLGTAVDSLNSIRAMVYDRHEISLYDLTDALRSNFAGQEALRLKLSNMAPHYGNDDDSADCIASTLFNTATAAVHALNNGAAEDKFVNSYFSYTSHVSVGETISATPDGRKAGEPLSDGPGPVQGKDTEGPTKLFNSILKLDYSHMTGAYATNCKLNPSLFGTKAGSLAFKNLMKAYLKSGGPQVQVNFVKQEDLIDAQKNPQEHLDIIVRIAGFCEYFVNLDYIQQNEIIKRTEHEIA